MPNFPVNTLDTAPDASKPSLQALQGAFGFIPNIAGAISTSPVLIDSLVALFGKVHGGSFGEPEIQILLLTNAVTNSCDWAVAFHSALALEQGIPAEDVKAIRARDVPRDPRRAALSILARTLIETRGKLDDKAIDTFLSAGFDQRHLLEVIAVVAASTITNYAGSVTRPPLEAPFQAHEWAA